MSKEKKKKDIIMLLHEEGEMSATSVATRLQTSKYYTDEWLKQLQKEGIVSVKLAGKFTFWSLTNKGVKMDEMLRKDRSLEPLETVKGRR